MSWEITIPSPGESVSEVVIAAWLKQSGEYVEKDEDILELESEKATLMVVAGESGMLETSANEGETVKVGDTVGRISPSAGAAKPDAGTAVQSSDSREPAPAKPSAASVEEAIASPAARKMIDEHGLSAGAIKGSGKDGRITKADVLEAMDQQAPAVASGTAKVAEVQTASVSATGRSEARAPMSSLRSKLAERLVAAKNQTAMLTTFNEADLSEIMALRSKYKERFKEKHEVGLGFMSFFAAAVCRALKEVPAVNSRIDGSDIVTPDYVDLGIAVSAPKGLVVPVIRDAHTLAIDELEREVDRLAGRARDNKITIDEMTGGSFTISNGGVFGSLLSTPILNPPQCAILGMHAIQRRPVAVGDEIVIRPMMYLAMSYDHRLIDGRESVTFLKRVKELVEDPMRLMLNV